MQPKLILLKGLPGSGKSTWAKNYIKTNGSTWKRINKDDLRSMLDDGKWTHANEDFIIKARDSLVIEALKNKLNVIVDDTNLSPKHEKRMREIATLCNAEFFLQDFLMVSLEECIKRDLLRSNSVGEKVIRDMYKKYLRPKPLTVEKLGLEKAILCDLDGTLALFGDANPYKRKFLEDKLNVPVRDILSLYQYSKFKIVIVSGRSDEFKQETIDWLDLWEVPYDDLYMRKEGDNRKDSIIKEEIYKSYIEGKYDIEFVLDDRDQVVEFWRSQGLTCLQVAEGDF